MDHVAIMRKSWGLTSKILSGRKKIESRWYSARRSPWNCITKGDVVYFKNAGEPVRIKATVNKVLRFAALNPKRVQEILARYGDDDGLERTQIPEFFRRFKDKKYCILVFLEHPTGVEPFAIDKTGFGAMAAWIAIDDVSEIRK